MPSLPGVEYKDAHVLRARGPREEVDPFRPVGVFVEEEYSRLGKVERTGTVLLANRECPFRCLYCDLWKQTTIYRVPGGAIPRQIDLALAEFAAVGPLPRQIKLYNAGNFFDAQAIPPEDYVEIIKRVAGFETVIVENHPKLCGPVVGDFARALGTQLEVALGLETIHPEVLPRLNKRMTLADFDGACERLKEAGIVVRAFVIVRPPFLDEEEGVEWAIRSVEHAFARGVDAVSLIPARAGNGLMEELEREGLFGSPRLGSVEAAFEACLGLGAGRVFVDLWNAGRWTGVEERAGERVARLGRMNLSQRVE